MLLGAVTEFTRQAEHLLRAPGHFNWSTVTLLGLAVYVYAVEIERSNWSVILAGLAFWLSCGWWASWRPSIWWPAWSSARCSAGSERGERPSGGRVDQPHAPAGRDRLLRLQAQ
jgi:hypothetical protein